VKTRIMKGTKIIPPPIPNKPARKPEMLPHNINIAISAIDMNSPP
jgi:hypothetical protein